MSCPQPAPKPPCCIARAFFRAAVSLQEQRAIEATAASQPTHSQVCIRPSFCCMVRPLVLVSEVSVCASLSCACAFARHVAVILCSIMIALCHPLMRTGVYSLENASDIVWTSKWG